MAQDYARALLGKRYTHFERLAPAFENAGVDMRHLVQPVAWYEQDRGWAERGAAYMQTAPLLFIDAAQAALADAIAQAETEESEHRGRKAEPALVTDRAA